MTDVVIAGIYGTAFIVVATLLALWSLWWILKAAWTNPAEREAEDDARARIARGEGWEEGSSAPVPFSDEEIAELSTALAPDDPAAVGVDARPRPDTPKGRRTKR